MPLKYNYLLETKSLSIDKQLSLDKYNKIETYYSISFKQKKEEFGIVLKAILSNIHYAISDDPEDENIINLSIYITERGIETSIF